MPPTQINSDNNMISNLCSEEYYNFSGNSDMTDYDSCDELSSTNFEGSDKNDDTLYNTNTKSDSELELIIANWAIRHILLIQLWTICLLICPNILSFITYPKTLGHY